MNSDKFNNVCRCTLAKKKLGAPKSTLCFFFRWSIMGVDNITAHAYFDNYYYCFWAQSLRLKSFNVRFKLSSLYTFPYRQVAAQQLGWKAAQAAKPQAEKL